MARTVTDGLRGIAYADLTGLEERIKKLRDEAEKALRLRADAIAELSMTELLEMLETAKRRGT